MAIKTISLIMIGLLVSAIVMIIGCSKSETNEFLICGDLASQMRPAISENIVVWQDERNGYPDVYGYDLVTKKEFPICKNASPQGNPAISGNIVVWQDERNGNSDIYGYDLVTKKEFPICTDAGFQGVPAISGNIVVWQDERNGNRDIYRYELSSETEFPICTDAGPQEFPAISGNIVVWQDKRNGNWDIYGYDLTIEKEFPIYVGEGGGLAPAICGNIVTWGGGHGGTIICAYDMSSRERIDITSDASICFVFHAPTNGDIVVCMHDLFISGYDLHTKRWFDISARLECADQAAVSGNKVVWSDQRNGNRDIYGADISFQ